MSYDEDTKKAAKEFLREMYEKAAEQYKAKIENMYYGTRVWTEGVETEFIPVPEMHMHRSYIHIKMPPPEETDPLFSHDDLPRVDREVAMLLMVRGWVIDVEIWHAGIYLIAPIPNNGLEAVTGPLPRVVLRGGVFSELLGDKFIEQSKPHAITANGRAAVARHDLRFVLHADKIDTAAHNTVGFYDPPDCQRAVTYAAKMP